MATSAVVRGSRSYARLVVRASLIGLVTLGAGCATMMYPGPRRGDDEIAIFRPGKNTVVSSIDGQAVDGGAIAKYEILPGRHEIVAIPATATDLRPQYSDPITVCFAAQPRHVYVSRASVRRTELGGVLWQPVIIDLDSDKNVRFECWENPDPPEPPTVGGPDVAVAKEPLAAPSARRLPPKRERAAIAMPKEHLPGTGFLLGLEFAFGGDKLATATYENGDSSSLTAGGGTFLYFGGTLTPLWYANTYGLGLGGSYGVKYNSISASNGDLSFIRSPLDLWLQVLMRASSSWFLACAGGGHREYGASVSGSGIASSIQADLRSSWGWMGDFGLHWRRNRHLAYAFSVRVTRVKYANAYGSADGTNVGLGFAIVLNL